MTSSGTTCLKPCSLVIELKHRFRCTGFVEGMLLEKSLGKRRVGKGMGSVNSNHGLIHKQPLGHKPYFRIVLSRDLNNISVPTSITGSC
jgi:hypothetical protein